MTFQPKLYAEPVRLVFFSSICAYCGKKSERNAVCIWQLAILSCNEHNLLGERDAKAWMHMNNLVHLEDYEKEPLFQETGLLDKNIIVKRTSGDIEKNWKIKEWTWYDYAQLKMLDDIWYIPVIYTGDEDTIQKYIPITDLKMSIPDDNHPLVDLFIKKLNRGFYISEYNAYLQAVQENQERDNPDNSIYNKTEKIKLEYVISEGNIGRVFDPLKQSSNIPNNNMDASTDPRIES
jgi:hypothetical protein